MNISLFIAQRLWKHRDPKKSFSRPILRLAMTSIAVGIVVMSITMATGTGLQKEIQRKIASFRGHLQVNTYTDNKSFETKPLDVSQEWYAQLKNTPGIVRHQQVALKAGILKSEKYLEGAVIKGIGADFDPNFFKEYLIEGKAPIYKNSVLNDSIVLSKNLADILDVQSGGRVAMYFIRQAPKPPLMRYFYVSGLYQTGLEEVDNSFLLGDIRHIQELNNWSTHEIGGIEVFLNDYKHIEAAQNHLLDELPYEALCNSVYQSYEHLFQWIKLFDVNIIIIIIVMFLVAAINISSALLILIMERTQMVGLLKALGADSWQIRKIFLYNAGFLLLRGMLWGNIIGLGFLWLQKNYKFIKLDQSVYYVNTVPIHLDIMLWILLNGAVLLLSIVVLILPSYYISTLKPVKTLRFD